MDANLKSIYYKFIFLVPIVTELGALVLIKHTDLPVKLQDVDAHNSELG